MWFCLHHLVLCCCSLHDLVMLSIICFKTVRLCVSKVLKYKLGNESESHNSITARSTGKLSGYEQCVSSKGVLWFALMQSVTCYKEILTWIQVPNLGTPKSRDEFHPWQQRKATDDELSFTVVAQQIRYPFSDLCVVWLRSRVYRQLSFGTSYQPQLLSRKLLLCFAFHRCLTCCAAYLY